MASTDRIARRFAFLLLSGIVSALASKPVLGMTTPGMSLERDTSDAVQVLVTSDGHVSCRDATVEEARNLGRRPEPATLHVLTSPERQVSALQASGLRIILRGTSQLEAYPQAKAVFLRAAATWEGLIRDPVTVVIDVDYGPTRFGEAWPSSSVLGSASGQVLGSNTYYGIIRDALQAKNPSLPQLPAGSLPTDLGSTQRTYSPSPVLRALGLIAAVADPIAESQWGNPPNIGFNSNFAFDVTPDDGVDPSRYDFLSVATHEIGHILGFTSYTGSQELYPESSLTASAWDFFRLPVSTASGAFASTPRTLTSGGDPVFFSGNSKLSVSTGRPDGSGGDGRQASHWKDDGVTGYYIGVMDPTFPKGVRHNLTTADRLALRAMGWDITANVPSISNAMTTKSLPESGCTPLPSPASTFSPTEARVSLYFTISGHADGEILTRVWYSPDGREYARGSWGALSASSTYCMPASLTLAGTSAASLPGAWRVRVFSNVQPDVPYVDLSFQVLSASSTTPTIYNAMTAKSVPDPLCSAYPSLVSTFGATDPSVYLYYRVNGFAEAEALSVQWTDPSGSTYRRASWSPLSTQYSYYCMSDRIDLAGAAAAQKPGAWRIRVTAERLPGVVLLDTSFTVNPPATDVSAGTWLLTSSARAQGAGAFWRTDLTIRNNGTTSATVLVKFLGHSDDGRGGPERLFTMNPGALLSWRDVLSSLFGLESDYGPILVRSSSALLSVLGETFTPGGGGTYGQAVPALAASSLISGAPRSILGVRQNASYRTNLMLASAVESPVDVDILLLAPTGSSLGSKRVRLGPLSRAQYNVANDFGASNLDGGVFLISSPTPGALVGAYASVIDSVTADPRTLLPQ
jgi:hypothetical protein